MMDVKTNSREICEKLLRKGVVVRSLASYGYDTFIRINAGTDQENKICVDALISVAGK
jgi:histidinol-phosphate aminotransferase